MAATARVGVAAQKHPTFDLQSLWRVAAWGLSASLALLLAALAGYSETGSRRLAAALGGPEAQMQGAASREAENERDTSTETLRALAADRDRLLARVAMIERHLDDLTGSIKAQVTSQVSASSGPPVSAPLAVPSAAREATQPTTSETPSANTPINTRPQATLTGTPAPEYAPLQEPKTQVGVDIGGAANFDGLRQLWSSAKNSNAAPFEGLTPIVAVNESGRGRSPELRLIVGPFFDAEAAVRWCTTLAAANRFCQLSSFEGQRLTDADRMIERKPPPKAAPRGQQTPRLFGLF